MPKFDYDKSYATAERLLEKFGGTGSIVKGTPTTADPTKPWIRTVADASTSTLMCVVPLRKTNDNRHNGADDTSLATHKGIVLWQDTAEIKIDDHLVYESKTWNITDATPLKPASKGLIYICELYGVE